MRNPVDNVVSFFSPSAGLKRMESRARMKYASSIFGGGSDFSFGEPAGYDVPGSRKRSMRGWSTHALSPDSDTLPKSGMARAASRDLVMNTPLASAIMKRINTNVIGHGLTLQSRVDREMLGLSDDYADAWERKVESLFRVFADSKNVDLSATQNFYELQRLAFISPLLSGDLFFSLPWVARKGSPFELRIKLMESDLCCNPNCSGDTYKIAGGIEVDDYGAPLAYHFISHYPIEADLIDFRSRDWVRIPAFDASGRRNIYHLYEKTRPGQRRGIPFLTPVFNSLKQVSRLCDAKLMQNLIQTFFTVFVKDSKGPVSLQPNFSIMDSAIPGQDPDKENQYELGQANIVELDDSKDVTIADPNRTDTAFESFFNAMVKMLSASCEIPFEQLLLHFQASYSASRAALLEAWKFYRRLRTSFASDFCQPVYEEFLFELVSKNVIEAPGFMDDPIRRAFWCKAKWGGSGQGLLNPQNEIGAAVTAIKNNLSSHEDEYTAMSGGDWEATFKRSAREKKLVEKNEMQPANYEGKVE